MDSQRSRACWGILATWIAFGALCDAQVVTFSRVTSPTVVSTFVGHDGALELLVLWRGKPGWFIPSGPSGAGGSGRERWVSISYGGLDFAIDFNDATRSARLLNTRIALDKTNVVL